MQLWSSVCVGEPSPPTNLTVDLPARGLGVNLSWLPGFALEGEEIIFVITSLEVATGVEVESLANTSSVTLTPTSEESTCQHYRFTVNSQNLFSLSTSEISVETLIPTGELDLCQYLRVGLRICFVINFSSTFCGEQ